MTIYRWFIVILWFGLIIFWWVSAISAKRSVGSHLRTWKEIGLRLIVAASALIVLALPPLRHAFRDLQAYQTRSAILGVTGVVLCIAGVALAVTARVYLGRNWGMPVSLKENPELVTNGPYRYVRHPIYSGVMLAMLGTAIGASPFWLIPFVFFGGYFVSSARREEKIMIAQFPEQYPAYMRQTRMLVPLLL